MAAAGGLRIPLGGGGFSFGTIILIGVVCLMLGINPLTLLTGGGLEIPNMPRPDRQGGPQNVPGLPGQGGVADDNDSKAQFVRQVLADTEDVWDQIFKGAGRQYPKPKLVLFRGATPTACGTGQSAMGPFYCPADKRVYIDLAFYDDLKRRFRAPGDFAQAYVIAHEIGHHVQTLLGIADRVQALKQNARSEGQANLLQVRMELQADCFAGVWASLNHQMKNRLAARRHRERVERCGGHRRRPPAEADAGLRRAGVVHARQLGAARALVQARSGHRPDAGVRHLQRAESMSRAIRRRAPCMCRFACRGCSRQRKRVPAVGRTAATAACRCRS